MNNETTLAASRSTLATRNGRKPGQAGGGPFEALSPGFPPSEVSCSAIAFSSLSLNRLFFWIGPLMRLPPATGRSDRHSGAFWLPKSRADRIQPQNRKNELAPTVVRRFGLARPIPGPQQQRQIARRGLNQQLLVNIFPSSHPQPVHPSGIELMRKISLHPLATPRLQTLAPRSLNPSSVAYTAACSAARLFHCRAPRSGSAI